MYKDVFEEYGKKLCELGQNNPNVVVVDCDLGQACSTSSFKNAIPDRYINVGIAEQNAFGVAAGLAESGFIPVVHTFAVFAALRASEQIRNSIALPKMNVKIIGARAGITNALLGATHHSIEDIAVMSAIPNMVVLAPYDCCEIGEAIEEAVNYKGPVYIRLDRIKSMRVNCGKTVIGKSHLIKDGSDLTLIGVGDQVINCIEASKTLADLGYSIRVVNLSTIKPIDREIIYDSANKTKGIITVESHNVIGGAGSEICRIVAEKNPTIVKTIGIKDCFTETGDYDDLLKEYNIDKDTIVSEALAILKKC
ncbi:MAG: transketolase C-terminal domain-containing protein [Bacillota bacterium]|nr:transketolase C-terminal domain-containing protein [Bacillota bacterium]